jgi:hypothetical protein
MTFRDFLNSNSKSTTSDAPQHFLTDHHGAGDAFLVLEQERSP